MRSPLALALLVTSCAATPPSTTTASPTATTTTTTPAATTAPPAPAAPKRKRSRTVPVTEVALTRYVDWLERVREALARETAAVDAVEPDGRRGLEKLREEVAARVRRTEEEARAAVGLDADAMDELFRLADDWSGVVVNLERAQGDDVARWRAARDGMVRDRGAELGGALTRHGERLTRAYVGVNEARTALDQALAAIGSRPFEPPIDKSIDEQLAYTARFLELAYAGCRSATVTTVRDKGLVRLALTAPCKTPEARRGTIEIRVEDSGSGKPPIWSIEAIALELGELSVTGPLFRGRATTRGLESDDWTLSRCQARGEPRTVKTTGVPPECSAAPPVGNRLQLSMCVRARRAGSPSDRPDPLMALVQGAEALGAAAQAAFVLGASETIAFRALCAAHGLSAN